MVRNRTFVQLGLISSTVGFDINNMRREARISLLALIFFKIKKVKSKETSTFVNTMKGVCGFSGIEFLLY